MKTHGMYRPTYVQAILFAITGRRCASGAKIDSGSEGR